MAGKGIDVSLPFEETFIKPCTPIYSSPKILIYSNRVHTALRGVMHGNLVLIGLTQATSNERFMHNKVKLCNAQFSAET